MKAFLIRLVLFLIPLIVAASLIEYWARQNEYRAKARHIANHQSEIELMILGSSQSHRAFNPEYIDLELAPLMHGGGALNVDMLLLEKFLPKLPQLKAVMFELSPYALEIWIDRHSIKNHLYWVYYGVNNYGRPPPLKSNLLLTANPKAHLERLWSGKRKSPLNAYGFITRTPFHLSDSIKSQIQIENQRRVEEQLLHFKEDQMYVYRRNVKQLNQAVRRCRAEGLKVIFFLPPLHASYKEKAFHQNPDKWERRDHFLEKWRGKKDVYIWNCEDVFSHEADLFIDGNHLAIEGAEKLSNMLNAQLKEIGLLP